MTNTQPTGAGLRTVLFEITDERARHDAAARIRQGELVGFPTETVYGLGGDATNDTAVARIFEAKGRPRFNPLICHVPTVEEAFMLGVATDTGKRVAEAFWPGPLTLVLRCTETCSISLLASAGLDTVAIRVPGSASARAFLKDVGRPVAAPSANRSGRISPTTAAHVLEELDGRISMILDGGSCEVGLESTVLDVSAERPRLLRPGSIGRAAIEVLTGPIDQVAEGDPISAPGMLASHYAPHAAVRLNAIERRQGEAFLDFGATLAGEADADLSPTGDLREAAANLFAFLRRLDQSGCRTIAVAPIAVEGDETGLEAAILDRLARAAAPR